MGSLKKLLKDVTASIFNTEILSILFIGKVRELSHQAIDEVLK